MKSQHFDLLQIEGEKADLNCVHVFTFLSLNEVYNFLAREYFMFQMDTFTICPMTKIALL